MKILWNCSDTKLAMDLNQLNGEIGTAKKKMDEFDRISNDNRIPLKDQLEYRLQRIMEDFTGKIKTGQHEAWVKYANADPERLGYFWLKAPEFADVRPMAPGRDLRANLHPVWTVLTPDFWETMRRHPVKPKDPLLPLGNKEGPWEVELKIPQKHMGQVLYAFDYVEKTQGQKDVLDVKLIVKSDPNHTFLGKLERSKVAYEATPRRDDSGEPESVVMAWVRLDGDDIPPDMRVPRSLMLTGTDVHAKVVCGRHRMGYSLFYGVWEFLYEKVVFFF